MAQQLDDQSNPALTPQQTLPTIPELQEGGQEGPGGLCRWPRATVAAGKLAA